MNLYPPPESDGFAPTASLQTICTVFHDLFRQSHDVIVQGGWQEPLYLASTGGRPAEIRFTRDYLNSCLHEIAHWCVAGAERRKLDDYGYWYAPDGRNHEEQQRFFQAEIKPQAFEWAFALACGAGFRVSCDNLTGDPGDAQNFENAVRTCLRQLLGTGFPKRAEQLVQGLMTEFHPVVLPEHRHTWILERLSVPVAD